ncbi:hypothetical protein DPMN_105194 [Dreissena polymorpha]|uniref:Uncharacterized protein n=1 Tax=Dreissena polymorpha TaxID=45954 RepID=A0A9D4K310_DREPO|nr:hypothetical protein DPMN_105194 [Dreissena polymorpha]
MDKCEPVGFRGDLMDNDCDCYIDEEIVDGVDNDKDGLIDEDAIGHVKENLAVVAIRPINCKVSGDSNFNVFQQITGSNCQSEYTSVYVVGAGGIVLLFSRVRVYAIQKTSKEECNRCK